MGTKKEEDGMHEVAVPPPDAIRSMNLEKHAFEKMVRSLKDQQVVWLLDFLQKDLDRLSDGDSVKLLVDVCSFIQHHLDPESEVLAEGAPNPVAGRRITHYILPNKRSFDVVLYPAFDALRQNFREPDLLLFAQECLKKFLAPILEAVEHLNMRTGEDARTLPSFQTFEVQKSKVNFGCQFLGGENPTISIKARLQTASLGEALLLAVAHVLEDIPIGVFHTCSECGKWFANFSGRAKQFCSNKCAARYGVRRNRQELKSKNPEKYVEGLRAGAERAHKSYASKIQNGKPARRPYKHKQEGE